MPCDFEVTVTFNTDHTFTFAPDPVTIPHQTQTICFKQPSNPNYTFAAFCVKSTDFSWSVHDDQIVVTDVNQDAEQTTYDYYVTIVSDGTAYTSDPQIINRGP